VRVAVISDTHLPLGRRRLPIEALEGAEAILHAGDVVAPEVLDALDGLGVPVWVVAGNNDGPRIRERAPERLEVELGGARVGMVHDAGPAKGRLARLRRAFPACDAVVFGHSHIPLHEAEDGFHIFNPGSLCEKRRQPVHTMGWLEAADGDLRFELVELGP
jgi:uncharacterized protein